VASAFSKTILAATFMVKPLLGEAEAILKNV